MAGFQNLGLGELGAESQYYKGDGSGKKLSELLAIAFAGPSSDYSLESTQPTNPMTFQGQGIAPKFGPSLGIKPPTAQSQGLNAQGFQFSLPQLPQSPMQNQQFGGYPEQDQYVNNFWGLK